MKILLLLSQVMENNEGSSSDKAASFLFENAPLVITLLVLSISIAIILAVFLVILWKFYKKDELILKKYNIDATKEDVEEKMWCIHHIFILKVFLQFLIIRYILPFFLPDKVPQILQSLLVHQRLKKQ